MIYLEWIFGIMAGVTGIGCTVIVTLFTAQCAKSLYQDLKSK